MDKLYVDTLGNVAQISFGAIDAEVNKDAFRFEDDLNTGKAILNFKNEAIASVFGKHHLVHIDDKTHPEIMTFIKCWGDWFESKDDLKGTDVVYLGNGEYEISVSKNSEIQLLANDPKFQQLNTPKTSQQNSDQSGMLASSQSSDQQHIIE